MFGGGSHKRAHKHSDIHSITIIVMAPDRPLVVVP